MGGWWVELSWRWECVWEQNARTERMHVCMHACMTWIELKIWQTSSRSRSITIIMKRWAWANSTDMMTWWHWQWHLPIHPSIHPWVGEWWMALSVTAPPPQFSSDDELLSYQLQLGSNWWCDEWMTAFFPFSFGWLVSVSRLCVVLGLGLVMPCPIDARFDARFDG